MTLAKPLTATERHLLREVESIPDKIVSVTMLRHSGRHLSARGFKIVVNRLIDRNLLVHQDDNFGTLCLTFSGLLSLREAA